MEQDFGFEWRLKNEASSSVEGSAVEGRNTQTQYGTQVKLGLEWRLKNEGYAARYCIKHGLIDHLDHFVVLSHPCSFLYKKIKTLPPLA